MAATKTKPKAPAKISNSIKQVYFTTKELNNRLSKYASDKGLKTPDVSRMALNAFLSSNNY